MTMRLMPGQLAGAGAGVRKLHFPPFGASASRRPSRGPADFRGSAGKGGRTARIAVLVERRYLSQAMPSGLLDELARRGTGADILCPTGAYFESTTGAFRDSQGHDHRIESYDAIVSRNRNGLGLAVLAYAEFAGVLAINSHKSTQRIRNKAKMALALERAGVPCAPTVLADDVASLAGLPAEFFPLILKATYGDNSQGLRLARRPEDLGDIHWGERLVLAQRFLPNDGFDLKLYVCGGHVTAVRKPSPFNGDPNARAEPVALDARMTELALRCGELFGLEIYGVDTIETPSGPVVIEVNEFPNFSGVPGAAGRIADYVLGRLAQRTESAR